MRAAPREWAKKAIAMYDFHEADAIVAEKNQGGEMVKEVIHAVRRSVRVILVHASRGKHVRAEPISALYSLDKVSHVGAFPELERQLCLITDQGYDGIDSPDRADALVWLFTELFPKLTRREPTRTRALPARANNAYNPHRMHETRRFR
jgi:phage terminase large subunit-like protein